MWSEFLTPDADRVAAIALAVPGVSGLFGGPWGQVASHLPGRRVVGVRRRGDRWEVHLVLEPGSSPRAVGDLVREALRRHGVVPVRVVVATTRFTSAFSLASSLASSLAPSPSTPPTPKDAS